MTERKKKWTEAYLARVRDPIIADRSLDLMCASFWLCLSIWGVAGMIAGLPAIHIFSSDIYERFWGGSVGILSLVAFTAALSTFFNTPDIQRRIRTKRAEMIAAAMAAGFISVLPALLLIAVLTGDWDRFTSFWSALAYIIIPVWRTRHLSHRIAKLREIQEDLATGQIKLP